MKPVRLLPEAQEELEAAALWYEARSVGLGAAFADAVELALGEIGSHPQEHGRWSIEAMRPRLGGGAARVSEFPCNLT